MHKEAALMHKRPILPDKLRRPPSQFSWVDQRFVRERYIDHLSHQACTLYLFLVTVADAQGLSYYADRSLCQRLSMSQDSLRQARRMLIQRGLLAYQRPLYQVLALEPVPPQGVRAPNAHDEPVDLKAVFERIWEVLS
jgi:hypothetical protein